MPLRDHALRAGPPPASHRESAPGRLPGTQAAGPPTPRANIITHIHTDASNAEASELDDAIREGICRACGADTSAVWSECFTPIERILQLLERPRGGPHGPVHMVTVTDHMRSRSHRLPEGHLRAAAADHRLALGAELATRTRDIDGRYHKGPEILAYGGPERVQGPAGEYYGLSQALIDELYDTCLDDEHGELCTRRARDLLLERGVAHGISHPFDGNFLSFEGLFCVISEFAFVETINGGYFSDSAQVLDAYIRFNNAVLAGARLPEHLLNPMTRRILSHIRRHGRPIYPWSGSDAHVSHLDRVVVAMADPAGRPAEQLEPGDLFSAMLQVASLPIEDHPAGSEAPPFIHLGQPATPMSQLGDIVKIIFRNLHDVVRYHERSPLKLARVVYYAYKITHGELQIRDAWLTQRKHLLKSEFDPVSLLPQLRGARSPLARPADRPAAPLSPIRPCRSVA